MKLRCSTTLLASLAALGLSSCASTPSDDTPQELTSVITASYVLNGLFVPDSKGEQTVYTREDMRTIHDKVKRDSFYMRWANSDTSGIFRMDQNLLWQVDHTKKQYQECALSGCSNLLEELFPRDDDTESYESYEERGCETELTRNDFEVVATGKSRQMQGMETEEYTVTWTTEFTDDQGLKDLNLVQMVFWTTTPNAEMTEAWRIHQKATDRYLDSVGNNQPLSRLLGQDGFRAISALTGDTEKGSPDLLGSINQELSAIQGYPLSIKFEWFQKQEACVESKPAKEKESLSIDLSNGVDGLEDAATSLLGGLLKSAANDAVDKKVDAWMKDVRVRYIYDIQSVENRLAHNSNFEVPNNYKMLDRN